MEQIAQLQEQLGILRNQSAAAYDQQQGQTANLAQRTAIIGESSQRPPFSVRIPQPQRFKGVRDEPRILEWAHQATTYLRAARMAETQDGVWHISNFLDGDAAVWWRLQCDKYDRGVSIAPQNWAEMKMLLIAQFQVFNHWTDVKDRYTALRQQTSVSSYVTKFRALVVELPDESEANQIYQFLKGLKPEIQARTRTHKPVTLLQAMDIADEADRANIHAFKGSSSARTYYSGRDSRPSDGSRYPTSSRSAAVPMQIGTVRIKRNTGQGIIEDDDPPTNRRSMNAMSSPGPAELQRLRQENRCFYCRKEGHPARECPKRRADRKRHGPRQPRRQAEN